MARRGLEFLGLVLFVAAFLGVFPDICSAQELTVTTEKDIYRPGDEIFIINRVKNTADIATGLTIETRVSGVGFTYYPTVMRSGVDLTAGEEKELQFSLYVIDTMPAGEYQVTSSILDEEDTIKEATCLFEVTGTLGIIDIELLTCRNQSCDNQATLFHRGEVVYLNYISSVQGLSTTATLILPNDTQKQIQMPSSYKPKSSGTYMLRVTASKEGYKTLTKEIEFGVLEAPINVLEGETPTFPTRYVTVAAIGAAVIVAFVIFLRSRRGSRSPNH
jgi:hypothetical protein